MKRILWTALLALPFCTQPAQAQINISHSCYHNGIPPISVKLNTPCLSFNLFAGGGRTQLGPWYQYWPYEAHFQQGVPIGGMQGPNIMTLPPQYGQAGYVQPQFGQAQYAQPQYAQSPRTPPAMASIPSGQQQAQPQQAPFQPVGYFYPGQAPSYWYGR